MTTYAEKADIAAKAVKVLDSVTMKRQSDMAKRFAKRAMKTIDSWHNTCIVSARTREARHLIQMVESAVSVMESRLNKPRYTLKDGEWVRKTVTQTVDQAFAKEFDSHRRSAAQYMASMPMASYGAATGYVTGRSSIHSPQGYLSSPIGGVF